MCSRTSSCWQFGRYSDGWWEWRHVCVFCCSFSFFQPSGWLLGSSYQLEYLSVLSKIYLWGFLLVASIFSMLILNRIFYTDCWFNSFTPDSATKRGTRFAQNRLNNLNNFCLSESTAGDNAEVDLHHVLETTSKTNVWLWAHISVHAPFFPSLIALYAVCILHQSPLPVYLIYLRVDVLCFIPIS